MQAFIADLKYGARMMFKARAFSAVAILSLALGIGANTALFSVTDAVVLRLLPVPNPDQLVVFNWQAGKPFRTTGQRGTFAPGGYDPGMRGGSSFQPRLFDQLRDSQRSNAGSPLSSVFAYAEIDDLTVVVDHQAAVTPGQVVSGNYFAGLGVTPQMGRLITEADDHPGAPGVAVISHGYWQDRFGGDPSVIGKEIRVNQVVVTIVGVTRPAFEPPAQVGRIPSISLPLALEPAVESLRPMIDRPERLAPWWLCVMGRLKPGATLAEAQASLDGPFQARALEIMPGPRKPDEPVTLEAKDYPHLLARAGGRGPWEMRSIYAKKIYLLFGAAGLVLLIACANVANLLLTRAAQRSPEITVRLALGAGRVRLMRQLLTESLLLSALGGALGALLAVWGKDALAALGAFGALLPGDIDYTLNWRVLAFTLVVSVATGLLFGFAPAWRSANVDLTPALKEGGRRGGSVRSWLSRSLVVGQVAVSLILLIGAGLFVRTLLNLERVDVGFDQDKLLVFNLSPDGAGYSGERLNQLYRDVSERVEAIPGVTSSTFAQMPLLADYIWTEDLSLPGEPERPATEHPSRLLIVRENFVGALGMTLLRGREFTEHDAAGGARVAIVSQTLAEKYFPDQDPIGQRFGIVGEAGDRFEVVGVARDIKYSRQGEEAEALTLVPWRQWSQPMGGMTFSVRASGDPALLGPPIREAIRGLDDALPVVGMSTQTARSALTLGEERMYARVVSLFGALALFLAAIGLYGVMAFSVAQRTGEIGIRMALGAQAGNVVRLVMGQALWLVGLGTGVGAIGALALRRVVGSQLFGVDAADPLTFALGGGALLLAALMASFIPARRATRIDPIDALRCE